MPLSSMSAGIHRHRAPAPQNVIGFSSAVSLPTFASADVDSIGLAALACSPSASRWLRGATIRSAILTGDARAVSLLMRYFPDIVDFTFETNAIFAVLSGQVNPAQELSRSLTKVARLRSLAVDVEYIGHLALDDSESSDILLITRLSVREMVRRLDQLDAEDVSPGAMQSPILPPELWYLIFGNFSETIYGSKTVQLGHLLRSRAQTLDRSVYRVRVSGYDFAQYRRSDMSPPPAWANIWSAVIQVVPDVRTMPLLGQYFPDAVDLSSELATLSAFSNLAAIYLFLVHLCQFRKSSLSILDCVHRYGLCGTLNGETHIHPLPDYVFMGNGLRFCGALETLELLGMNGWESDIRYTESMLLANAETLRHLQLTVPPGYLDAPPLNLSVINDRRLEGMFRLCGEDTAVARPASAAHGEHTKDVGTSGLDCSIALAASYGITLPHWMTNMFGLGWSSSGRR
ncbi:hypothetical protein BDZ89DRAFT_1254675 [Hymenopellis radicata]|nr:hypothetical protein BDZ89DRAFT_1254675 [Hymenopellis radicata]